MAELEKIEDVLEVAIRIERKGIEFYNKLNEVIKSPEAKDVFSFLAAEEEKHIGVFRKMLDNIADYSPRFKYPGEYELFLDGMASRAVASFVKMQQVLSTKNAHEAINLAIGLENETINFYAESYKKFKAPEDEYIQDVIDEEKKHILKLEEVKAKLKF